MKGVWDVAATSLSTYEHSHSHLARFATTEEAQAPCLLRKTLRYPSIDGALSEALNQGQRRMNPRAEQTSFFSACHDSDEPKLVGDG